MKKTSNEWKSEKVGENVECSKTDKNLQKTLTVKKLIKKNQDRVEGEMNAKGRKELVLCIWNYETMQSEAKLSGIVEIYVGKLIKVEGKEERDAKWYRELVFCILNYRTIQLEATLSGGVANYVQECIKVEDEEEMNETIYQELLFCIWNYKTIQLEEKSSGIFEINVGKWIMEIWRNNSEKQNN